MRLGVLVAVSVARAYRLNDPGIPQNGRHEWQFGTRLHLAQRVDPVPLLKKRPRSLIDQHALLLDNPVDYLSPQRVRLDHHRSTVTYLHFGKANLKVPRLFDFLRLELLLPLPNSIEQLLLAFELSGHLVEEVLGLALLFVILKVTLNYRFSSVQIQKPLLGESLFDKLLLGHLVDPWVEGLQTLVLLKLGQCQLILYLFFQFRLLPPGSVLLQLVVKTVYKFSLRLLQRLLLLLFHECVLGVCFLLLLLREQ
jgi:hypothetical protein